MTQALGVFSAAVAQLAMSAAPLVCAIRVGANRHITGLVCHGETIVTADQALPALESYTVVLSNRLLLAARPGTRDPARNLAALRLGSPWPAVNSENTVSSGGSVAIIVGADADGSPTIRLTVVHRFARTADGFAPVLDLSGERVDQGSLV